MNRTLVLGIAIFFAVVGIALLGTDSQAVAGHGWHRSAGVVGCGCDGGVVQKGYDGGVVQKGYEGGVVQKGCDGGVVQKGCAGVVACGGPMVGCRGRARCCGPVVRCAPPVVDCCGVARPMRWRRGFGCAGVVDCCGPVVSCCGPAVVSPVQKGGAVQKADPVPEEEPQIEKPEPTPAKAASLDRAPTVFYQVSFRR